MCVSPEKTREITTPGPFRGREPECVIRSGRRAKNGVTALITSSIERIVDSTTFITPGSTCIPEGGFFDHPLDQYYRPGSSRFPRT
jgi:hypothetical protein